MSGISIALEKIIAFGSFLCVCYIVWNFGIICSVKCGEVYLNCYVSGTAKIWGNKRTHVSVSTKVLVRSNNFCVSSICMFVHISRVTEASARFGISNSLVGAAVHCNYAIIISTLQLLNKTRVT